jgi:hypothetical protein
MRALSYMIALVFVLTGPSMAGSADRDMPGVGTFTYCGSPVMTPPPDMMAAIGQ